MNKTTPPSQIEFTATKRVLKNRRQLERQIAHLEAINAALRDELPSKSDQIARLQATITNMSIEQNNRIAELEAINAALREELPSKNKRIVMLERKISNMSVDLASSRAREDETSLMLRRSSQGSSMSDCESNVLPAEKLVEDSMKSGFSPAQTSSSSSSSSCRQFHRSFSLPIPSWVSSSTQDDINDSTRSLRRTGVSSIIGNMMKLDRSDSSQNLRVDFPAGGRESYRLHMSDLTVDYSAQDETCEQDQDQEQEHGRGGDQKPPPTPHRIRPNRSLSNRHLMGSNNSRLISSTVIFPMEGDDDSLGFK
mmetsp:Transcript_27160/g.42645  ORF Transcript_27160/g.42645 Transcript_27160/m.42645 type:complete len:310 (-) Transcript_27160:133-1062(-)